MITDTVLQAIPREDRGKNASRRLRADGRIPVAVYGQGKDPVAASINARELGALLRSEAGRHAIFTLAVDGADSSPVKIHAMELDPVTSRVKHLDLMRISMTEKTKVSVPLEFVGEAEGVRVDGGMMDVHMHEIEIECLPRDVPANIPVDVTNLGVGEHLTVGQIEVDEDAIRVVTDADHVVVGVLHARVVEEPVETGLEGLLEPMVPPVAGESESEESAEPAE